MPVTRSTAIGLALAFVVACGADDPESGGPADVPPPAGLAATAELGYPRDLVERGRFNLVMTNDGADDITVVSKALVSDVFAGAPADDRRSILPAGGRRVALQTLFGDVTDCDSDGGVDAAAHLVYVVGDDPEQVRSTVPLDDTAVLDEIRAQTCTARHVNASVEFTFDAVTVDGESIATDLVFRRSEPGDRLEVEAIVGTVLFGAESSVAADERPRVMGAADLSYTLPLVFDVNRCDPHAVAETTKKYGLDLWIAVDDQPARQVPIDIDPVLGDLELILERCKERTGQ